MKINNLKINGFGKIKNKELVLSKGINIVFGDNEAGKSTIQKFISGMLYGVSKNKNGKEISDFDKYKPWFGDEFSGKIKYTLDNEEEFEVYREFKKKNPVIYNSQKEDISKTFNIDKTKGIDFFTEQTGIDEETFYSTAITEQEGIKLSKASQNSIVQKMSNLVTTGDDSISFKRTLDRITRKQNEEVGTSRTSQRPINIVKNKIDKLKNQKSNLEMYRRNLSDNTSRKEQLLSYQEFQQNKLNMLKEIKNNMDKHKIENAEINFNKKLEKDYNQKIRELNSQITSDIAVKENKENKHKNYYIILAIFLIVFIILMFVNPYKLVNFLFLIPAIIIIYKKYSSKNKIEVDETSKQDNKEKIINEIEILNKNKEEQKNEAEKKEQKLKEEIELEKENIINKYVSVLGMEYVDRILNEDYNDILREIDKKENRINTIKFNIKTLESSYVDIQEKLEDLSRIEEELQDANSEFEELASLNNSYNIAIECLEKAYIKVKENLSPRFMQNLCDIVSKISSNRYNNIILSDKEGLNVEISNGSYIPVSRLSVGTIDQMYLSLRLSALYEISDETMPIILDEVFAYFDDERLENILKYIKTNFVDNQIILFTCSRREGEILDKLDIKYNLINI